MFDAHNHLHFAAFDPDREAVLARAIDAGVGGMILAGYDAARRDLAAQLARRAGVWATGGLHPWALDALDDDGIEAELDQLRALDWSAFCGLGELGLDWVRAVGEAGRARQIDVFRRQLQLAEDLGLPVVIHSVRSNAAILETFAECGPPGRGGLIHSFWGSAEEAKRFVDYGMTLSIGTQITRQVGQKMERALREVGLANLCVETDAPSRPPARVARDRNEPAYLSCVVEALALVLGTDPASVAEATTSNARRVFDLGDEVLRDE